MFSTISFSFISLVSSFSIVVFKVLISFFKDSISGVWSTSFNGCLQVGHISDSIKFFSVLFKLFKLVVFCIFLCNVLSLSFVLTLKTSKSTSSGISLSPYAFNFKSKLNNFKLFSSKLSFTSLGLTFCISMSISKNFLPINSSLVLLFSTNSVSTLFSFFWLSTFFSDSVIFSCFSFFNVLF